MQQFRSEIGSKTRQKINSTFLHNQSLAILIFPCMFSKLSSSGFLYRNNLLKIVFEVLGQVCTKNRV